MRTPVLMISAATLLLGSSLNAQQIAWDTPSFFSPRPMDDIGLYVSQIQYPGGESSTGLSAIWRQSGNLNLGVRAKKGGVQLSWQAPSSGGSPTGYFVYRGTSPTTLTRVATLGTTTTYNSNGLTKGVTYYFQVSAVNSSGEGARSSTASATPT